MKKETRKQYDYLIIGSGPAGFVAAVTASQLGLKTAVVERNSDMFGGVCLNEGCIPLKSMIDSAKKVNLIRNSSGLCKGKIDCGEADLSEIVEKSGQSAEMLKKGLAFLFRKNKIDLLMGEAKFLDKNTVSVCEAGGATHNVTAKNFLIATGSKPKELGALKYDGKCIISSSEAVRLDKIPEKILIVGGGAIGVEFASFYNSIGARVTLIEVEDHLLPTEDKEISRGMRTIFVKKGISVIAGGTVKKASCKKNSVAVEMEAAGEIIKETYDIVLVSIGRVPSSAHLSLENAGVRVEKNLFIPVDKFMCTNVKNIFAAGDVIDTPMLAHTAQAEGEIAAKAAALQKPRSLNYGLVPHVVYSAPQAASVGMTEEDALGKKMEVEIGKQFFRSNGLAQVASETDGFVKIIADKKTRLILGAHILGYNASELIHEFVVAIASGLSADKLAETVHAHPTFAETAQDAARDVFGRSIHG
ncbi:MAG: dihydrolipoyl dehydrogenase [Candidatus Omnitrophica bacterium]|nr:dihydrolipoyl dehydrogenase [Candidatus Omnitrophota bacterium]